MSKELEDKKNEVAKIDQQIMELRKRRELEAQEVKDLELKETTEADVTITKNGLRLLIEGINCLVGKATSYNDDDSEDLRNRRDIAAVKLMKAAAKALDPYAKEAYDENHCVKAVYTVSETVDVDDGAILATRTKNLRLELGQIAKKDTKEDEGTTTDDQAGKEPTNEELVDAWHQLDEVACTFVEKTGKTVSHTRLAGGKLDKDKLRNNFNVIVETILKIWPNCQLLTISDNANAAEVITAVLAGVKVIGKLVEKYKEKKASKKKSK